MADVFISYAQADREMAARLAASIERLGYSVWWDRLIIGGAKFAASIENEISAASVVIVLWSQASVRSPWVLDEAALARDREKLLPVSLGSLELPLGFRQFHAIDFSSWTGEHDIAPLKILKESIAQKIGTRAPPPEPLRAGPPRRLNFGLSRAALVTIGVMVPIFIGVVALFALRPEQRTAELNPASTGAAELNSASVAVLPFADLSEGHDKVYFADGIAEEILNALSRLTGLRVAGRTSSFAFRGRQDDLRAIARALGVGAILEGSVRSAGERLRVTAQLVSAADGFHLWSEVYDRQAGDIFAIQDEIARSVADALRVKLMGAVASQRDEGTVDVETYHLYLQGRFHFFQRGGDNLPKAIDLFKNAIARDAKFARAYAALAQAYYVLPYYTGASISHSRAQAERFARLAIQLDNRNADAHAALGAALQFDHRWQEGDAALARAVSLNPNDSTVRLWSGFSALFLGRASIAEAQLSKALAIDPVSGINLFWHAAALAVLGRTHEAEAEARRAADLGFGFADQLLGYFAYDRREWSVAATYAISGMDFGSLPDTERALTRLCLERTFGDPARLQELEKALDANFAERAPIVNDAILVALMRTGRIEQALALFDLDRLRSPENVLLWIWLPTGESVRRSAAFEAFARREGLIEAWRGGGWPDACRPVDGGNFACK